MSLKFKYTKVRLGKDPSGRKVKVNRRTRAMIRAAEAILKAPLTVVQGSYNTSTAASAGTHDKGGVVDFRTWDLGDKGVTVEEALIALRKVGFAAWHRKPSQGFASHIHAVALGDETLAWLANQQAIAYGLGFNGLGHLGRGGKDDGPNVPIHTWEQFRDRSKKKRRPWVKRWRKAMKQEV